MLAQLRGLIAGCICTDSQSEFLSLIIPDKVYSMAEQLQSFNFEQALAELHGLVEKMEQGGLTLQDSLQYFERGVGLIRHCQQALATAEQKVKILTEQQKLEPYQTDED